MSSEIRPGGDAGHPPVAHHHGAGAVTGLLEGVPPAAGPAREALELLEQRRSLPLRALLEPGPSPADLDRMLAIAARVPDHGQLVPWRFIVIEGEARAALGARLDALYGTQNPGLPPEKAHMWQDYLNRAPVTVVLVSRPERAAKIPVFHQQLSAGAAGLALMLAAQALGFSALWLLKWPGRDPDAAALLGIQPGEAVAGFFHIGRPAGRREDRPRPALEAIVTRWQP